MRKSIRAWVGLLTIGALASGAGKAAVADDFGHIGGGAGYGSDGFFGDAIGGLDGNGYVTDNHIPDTTGLIDDSWLKPGHTPARDDPKHKPHHGVLINQ
jgi:hypothetical protein